MRKTLRNNILEKRNQLNQNEAHKKSDEIRQSLSSLDEFKKAKTIHFYISKDKEVETRNLIKESNKTKTIVVPCIKKEGLISAELNGFCELKKNSFGVLEPVDPSPFPAEKIELTIVPGLVFDRKGYRLGYGKGYYDRFLKNIKATKVGLAYDFQIIEEVPKEDHDVKMDYVITEKGIIKCKNG